MHKTKTEKNTWIGVAACIIALCVLASLVVLFSRVIGYADSEYVNVMSLTENTVTQTSEPYAPAPGENQTSKPVSDPQFVMEAEVEIFKFSYDETGKITVIGPANNEDKLIAPGTSNLYQFTLANTGNVALDYNMTMEAYVTGTDLWLPVNARVWDYTNKYLVGSADSMVDVIELNSVNESAKLGAGRYAVYNLEWEWPFEWGNDEYDTMLGNLAVDDDLTLHIVIRTYAEYDETIDDNPGLPPKTGSESYSTILIIMCVAAFSVLCITFFVSFRAKRKGNE